MGAPFERGEACSLSSGLTRGLAIHLSPARGGRLVIVYLSFPRRLVFEIRLHRPPLVCSPFLSVWLRRRRVWSGAYHVAGQLLSGLDRPVRGRSADNCWSVDAGRPVDVLTRSPKRRMRPTDGSYARYHHGNLVIFVDFRVGVTTRSRHACFIPLITPLLSSSRAKAVSVAFVARSALLSLFSLALTVLVDHPYMSVSTSWRTVIEVNLFHSHLNSLMNLIFISGNTRSNVR